MKSFDELLPKAQTVAVICTQWGDSGKGKLVDLLAGEWADVIVRCAGGANAGHTINIKGREYIFHLVPSGILHDAAGKINVIGSGVAFDPRAACEELDALEEEGMPYNNLLIAHNAILVLPQHIVMDRVKESSAGEGKIGTTGRGIGPAYVDHYARIGLTVNDLLNRDGLASKIRRNLADKIKLLRYADPETMKLVMAHKHLECGRYHDSKGRYAPFDVDAIVERYAGYGRRLGGMIRGTDKFVRSNLGVRRILLEGAQGILLSVDCGTYPYVTSSDPSIHGLAKGAGLSARDVDVALGIVKAFYMTRVGFGPFPTEIGGEASSRWCNSGEATRKEEQARYHDASVNSPDEFNQGVGIRVAGREYGATTGRARRVGWLDLPLLRHSILHTLSPYVVLTKLDVLNYCDVIKICFAYKYHGEGYTIGEERFEKGDILNVAVMNPEVLSKCSPAYKMFLGWRRDISKAKTVADLPERLLNIIRYIESQAGVEVVACSVGADRNQICLA